MTKLKSKQQKLYLKQNKTFERTRFKHLVLFFILIIELILMYKLLVNIKQNTWLWYSAGWEGK
jgi:hypothetical protein